MDKQIKKSTHVKGTKYLDTLKKYEEATKALRFSDPTKNYNGILKALQPPALDAMSAFKINSERMEAVLRNPALEAMSAFQKTHLKGLETLRPPALDAMSAFKIHSERMEAALRNSVLGTAGAFQKTHLDKMEAALRNPALEAMKTFQQPELAKAYREMLSAFNSNLDATNKSISNFAPWLDQDSFSELNIDSNGEISIGSNSITIEQLDHIVSHVVDSVLNKKICPLESAINKLAKEIEHLKEPFIQKLVTCIIAPIIIGLIFSVINPINDYYVKDALGGSDKRAVTKNIKNTIEAEFGSQIDLRGYKMVIANTLNLREAGAKRSKIIGTLNFGSIVYVVNKGRSWSLVEWYDDEMSIKKQGWVLSRYLKKLK